MSWTKEEETVYSNIYGESRCKIVVFDCDYCGDYFKTKGTIKEARKTLNYNGWAFKLNKDLCPICKGCK